MNLPVDSLTHAKRIARARKVGLSTVVSQVISKTERSEELICDYETVFSGFSNDEASILDGVILEPPSSADR